MFKIGHVLINLYSITQMKMGKVSTEVMADNEYKYTRD